MEGEEGFISRGLEERRVSRKKGAGTGGLVSSPGGWEEGERGGPAEELQLSSLGGGPNTLSGILFLQGAVAFRSIHSFHEMSNFTTTQKGKQAILG